MKVRKWNVRRLVLLAGLLLAFVCPFAEVRAEEKAGMITDFELVSNSCIRLSSHISLEELKKRMPREIGVYLDGSKTPVRIPADWVSDADYDAADESYYLFMARWDQERYPLSPEYNEQGYLPFVEVEIRGGDQPAAIAAASGVDNIVRRAYQQVDIAWTPLKQIKGYIGLNGSLTATYYPGTTYYGIPYGQLVDSGKYVPHDASFDEFLEAVSNPNSVFYKSRGSYASRNSTYYGNDCSAFVSYAYGLPRMTTGMIGASSQFTRVSGNNIYNAQVGDCFNKSTSHVELITGMLYNDKGTLVTVEVCEQTPPKARKVRYSPAKVQSILNSGYELLRYKGRNEVRPPYYYNGYTEKKDSLVYVGDKFFASITGKKSGRNASNDGAGNVRGQDAAESADQVWYFEAQDDGTYIITSCKDGKSLGVSGKNVVMGNYTGSNSQRWYVYKNSGKYKLVAANGSLILCMSGSDNLTIADDTNSVKQGFLIKTMNWKGSVHMAAVELQADSFVYDGTAKTPAVTVKIGTTVLRANTDYRIAYSENVEAGKAKVTVTGIGEYTGEIIREFTIQKAPQELQVTISAYTAKEGEKLKITVSGNQTDLRFSSDNKPVAKVDQEGNVTCIAAGIAQIKVKAAAGSNYEAAERMVPVTVEHDYVGEVVPPTCVDRGYTTYICNVCGNISVGDYVEALGHVSSGDDVVQEPTCTENGWRRATCSVCHEVYTDVLPATGHAYGSWIPGNDGTHTRVCANNPEHIEKENCTYEYQVVKKAAENQEGILGCKCSVCGYFYTEPVSWAACIHQITALRDTSDATCTVNGFTGNTCCEICDRILEPGSVIPAFGHTWDGGVVTKAAAVGREGVKTFTCLTCGETRKEVLAALEPPLPKAGSTKKDSASGGIYRVCRNRVSVVYTGPLKANKKVLVIPNTIKIDGTVCKVTAIAANAFKGNKKLQQITIGKNVQEIGAYAFQNCTNLTTVSGGRGVKVIKRDVFSGCTKLKKITLKSEVTTLGPRSFKNCKSLTAITLPAKVTSIGRQTFYGCSKLKKITIKTLSLKSKNVGTNAFGGISKNAVATVPKKVFARYAKLLKAAGMKGKVRK